MRREPRGSTPPPSQTTRKFACRTGVVEKHPPAISAFAPRRPVLLLILFLLLPTPPPPLLFYLILLLFLFLLTLLPLLPTSSCSSYWATCWTKTLSYLLMIPWEIVLIRCTFFFVIEAHKIWTPVRKWCFDGTCKRLVSCSVSNSLEYERK